MNKYYVPASFDIFTAGYILFAMYSGIPPFKYSGDDFYKEIVLGNYERFWATAAKNIKKNKDFFPNSFKNLIISMLHPDP
jgi:hypothetical protein